MRLCIKSNGFINISLEFYVFENNVVKLSTKNALSPTHYPKKTCNFRWIPLILSHVPVHPCLILSSYPCLRPYPDPASALSALCLAALH